ncbi:NAD(P)/FAD-dependent oxidoreductase [Aeromicrobium piscarium]|uniref:Oxidoreductase n=1 Tax=Aeromicrobium piscarium TaxID=2590901 RepID=A0A554RXB8_9ACTN|nr:FAD-dependent oxidoreductase [Aeromicrobium piscarium]TSD58749.1 oxidoreductase [Aeromicrobium piscarium]
MTQEISPLPDVTSRHVAIVGASLAGIAAAEELRSAGFTGRVTVIDAEPDLPYDRPPLSKQFLTSGLAEERLLLKPEDWYSEADVRLELGERAVGLTPTAAPGESVTVELESGRRIEADDVVVATGGRAIEIPVASDEAAIHTLRTVSDARALQQALTSSTGELLVVGAGFIGLEVTSAAAALGWQVTVVDRAAAPLCRVLPADVVSLCLADLPGDRVELICNADLRSIEGAEGRLTAEFADGSLRAFDEVVAGIGMVPNLEWLRSAPVEIGDGIVCDGTGRTSMPHVWAAGDVSRWPNTATGLQIRTEQWQSAREQGRIVGRSLLGSREVWSTPPYFWTELFGRRVQVVGACDATMSVRVVTGERQRAIALVGDDALRAVVAIGNPRWAALGRRWLTEAIELEDAAHQAQELVSAATTKQPQ